MRERERGFSFGQERSENAGIDIFSDKNFRTNFFAYSSSCLTLKKDEKLFCKSFSRSNKTQWSKINIFVHLIHLLFKIYLMHIFPNFNSFLYILIFFLVFP